MKFVPAIFEDHQIRRFYDAETETWFFSALDIARVLTQQPSHQIARKCGYMLKARLSQESRQSVTGCHRLKLPAADGKRFLTDVASAETPVRLAQSVPSPKALCAIETAI